MGRIIIRGLIRLDPAFRQERLGRCNGYVDASYLVAARGPVAAGTTVLQIVSDELYSEQERWISYDCNPHFADPLRQRGMTAGQLRWVTREKRPIRRLKVECPLEASIDEILKPGEDFGPNTTLFAYGPQAVVCRLPRDVARFVMPGMEAGIRPIEWAAGDRLYGGSVQNIQRVGEHQQDVILDFSGRVPAFPFSTPFVIVFKPTALKEDIDLTSHPAIASAPSQAVGPTLPPRGASRSADVLRREAGERQTREAERTKRCMPSPELESPPLAPFGRSDGKGRRRPSPDIRLSEREWHHAKIRTLAVYEQIPSMAMRTTATIGLLPTDLTPSRGGSPSIDVFGGVGEGERLAVRFSITAAEWARIPRSSVRVTLEWPQPQHLLQFEGEPVQLGKGGHDGHVRVAVEIPPGSLRPGSPMSVMVMIQEARQSRPVLAVPMSAILRVGGGAEVLAHVDDGALKRIAVTTGAEWGGYVAIERGLAKGHRVVCNAAATIEAIALARAMMPKEQRQETAKGGTSNEARKRSRARRDSSI